MWLVALADAGDGSCGGKAAQLAKLVAAGLPVPPGFAIAGAAFREVVGEIAIAADAGDAGHALARAAEQIAAADPQPLAREVVARAGELGVVCVRSSASIEDGDAGAAAGVFSSRRAVAAGDAWAAVREVWTSALTPLAVAYARRRGAPAIATIGAIVQRFVDGERATVYTRAPGAPADVLVQRGEATQTFARATAAEANPCAQLALAAERAIGARDRGADVELVVDRDGAIWVVQARPIAAAPASAGSEHARVAPPPIALAALADGRRWTWDIAHNPDPLSPAQTSLVELVAPSAPWQLRVVAGYLYSAPRDDEGAAAVAPPTSAHDLETRARALIAQMLAALGDRTAPAPALAIADALARYAAFYPPWAELAGMISHARRALPRALAAAGDPHPDATAARLIGARPSAVEATLLAAARGEVAAADAITELSPLSPAWDVAVPTYGEQPELIRAAIARARDHAVSAPAPASATTAAATSPPAGLAADVELARLAADLGERDDALFARAQAMIRRALLARADELGIDREDAAWLPIADLAAHAAAIDRDTAHRRAAGARAAAARAARFAMPLTVGGDPAASAPPRELLHGVGTGPRVRGRVVRFASLASAVAVGRGDVVVARAITPALAVLVAGCAAIVSDTGGLLDHGAALARELGVPCVVGCHGAWSTLADGTRVEVDGDSGTVARV